MGKTDNVCEGETIVRVVQVVHGLPDDPNFSWVKAADIITSLRLLNHPLGAKPRQYIASYLEKLAKGGRLMGRDGAEEREYHIGTLAVKEFGKDYLEKLRREFRAQMAEARARATAADTPKRRFGLHPELVGVVERDNDEPITPSDLGIVLTLMITRLHLEGKIQPPPPKSLIERLLTSVHELCCVGRTPSDILPTQPAAAPT